MLKVKLPDGSLREYSGSVRPIDVAAEIVPAWQKRRWRPKLTEKLSGPTLPCRETAQDRLAAAAHQERPRSPRRHAASRRPRHGPGRDAAVRRRAARLRSDRRERLLLRLRLRRPAHGRRLPGDRSRDEEDHQGSTSRSSGSKCRATKPSKSVASLGQKYKVEHINTGLADHAVAVLLPPGRIHRPLPRPARPQHRAQSAPYKLLSIAGAYWKGDANSEQLQRLYATAFFDQAKSSTSTSNSRREPNAATTASRQAARALHHQPNSSAPASSSGCRKARMIRSRSKSSSKASSAAATTSRLHAAHRPRRAVQTSGHFPYYRTASSRPSSIKDGEALPAQADELPAPHSDLRGGAAQLPRPAGAAGRVRHRLSLRADRASSTA